MSSEHTIQMKSKVCLLGDAFVGKTSLVRRFVLDEFDDRYIPTIGTKVTKKEVTVIADDTKVFNTLMIWDIMGTREGVEENLTPYQRYKPQSAFYESAKGAFIVCDITRKTTFDGLVEWREALLRAAEDAKVIILANKSDMAAEAQVSQDQLKERAADFGCPFFMTSAKTKTGVEEAFNEMAIYLSRDISLK